MQITQQQYNSVVSGLRTQLELQRDHTRELQQSVAALADNSRRVSEAHQESKRVFDEECIRLQNTVAVLRERLTATGKCAKEGPTLDIMDTGWSPEYSAVAELHKRAAAKRIRAAKTK